MGRVVHYALSETDVERINARRRDAVDFGAGGNRTGYVVHVGNAPVVGQLLPLIVTAVWDAPSELNGQVLLDGNDSLWVTSALEGDLPGQWRWPERV